MATQLHATPYPPNPPYPHAHPYGAHPHPDPFPPQPPDDPHVLLLLLVDARLSALSLRAANDGALLITVPRLPASSAHSLLRLVDEQRAPDSAHPPRLSPSLPRTSALADFRRARRAAKREARVASAISAALVESAPSTAPSPQEATSGSAQGEVPSEQQCEAGARAAAWRSALHAAAHRDALSAALFGWPRPSRRKDAAALAPRIAALAARLRAQAGAAAPPTRAARAPARSSAGKSVDARVSGRTSAGARASWSASSVDAEWDLTAPTRTASMPVRKPARSGRKARRRAGLSHSSSSSGALRDVVASAAERLHVLNARRPAAAALASALIEVTPGVPEGLRRVHGLGRQMGVLGGGYEDVDEAPTELEFAAQTVGYLIQKARPSSSAGPSMSAARGLGQEANNGEEDERERPVKASYAARLASALVTNAPGVPREVRALHGVGKALGVVPGGREMEPSYRAATGAEVAVRGLGLVLRCVRDSVEKSGAAGGSDGLISGVVGKAVEEVMRITT